MFIGVTLTSFSEPNKPHKTAFAYEWDPSNTARSYEAIRKRFPAFASSICNPRPELGTSLVFRGYQDNRPFMLEIKVTEEIDAGELGNNNGYRCPFCRFGDGLTIFASSVVSARLLVDGTDNDGGDTEWDDSSSAMCGCGWQGTVGQFISVEVVEGDN